MAETRPGGLLVSLRRLADTFVAIVQTRLELLSNEVEEEAWRIWQTAVLTLVALACFGMSALVFTALVVVLLWDSHPVAALTGLGCLYLVLGMLAVLSLRARRRTRSRFFSASLVELAKDRQHLEPAREQTPG